MFAVSSKLDIIAIVDDKCDSHALNKRSCF